MKFRQVDSWQPGFWMANIWLLFLIFPVLSIITADLSDTRQTIGLVILGLFAVTHALGYWVLIQREMGLIGAPTSSGLRRFVDPERSEIWFGLLVALLVAGWVAVSWPVLGAIPFIVSFAVFNFSWRTAGIVFALCLALVILGPLAIGRLDEWWFLSAVLISAGVTTALGRATEERQHDVTALNTQLMVTEERERVARDVHDVLGHSLTAIVLKTQVTDRMLAAIEDPPPEVTAARAQLTETQDVSRKALSEIRATVSGLRSAALGDELAAARSVLADADIDLIVQGDPSAVPNRHHPALGWTVREAVTNIVRHSDASRCSIELDRADTLLTVRDDGVGAGEAREGNGLTGLRERLAAAGLELQVDGANGTVLRVTDAEVPA